MKSQQTATRSLELHIGQIAAVQNTKPQGGFKSDTLNPKQVMEITLKSGKNLNNEPPKKTKEVDAELSPSQVFIKLLENSRKFE